MSDRPAGACGTGPFTLVQGESTTDCDRATVREHPLACTRVWREARAAEVNLAANPHYWNARRGPRLREVVFRNDVPPARALDLVCDGEGEFDIVTGVPPAEAARVRASKFARLVTVDAVRAIAGVINRDAAGLPLNDVRARRALNHAVDRGRLVKGTMAGYTDPLAGLAPPCAVPRLTRLSPYAHDPRKAIALWREVGGGAQVRALRVAAFADCAAAAEHAAADVRAALGLGTEVTVLDRAAELEAREALADRRGPSPWDLLALTQGCQAVESVPLELHRAFVGETGEYRAGPAVPAFDAGFAELCRQTSPTAQQAAGGRSTSWCTTRRWRYSCAPRTRRTRSTARWRSPRTAPPSSWPSVRGRRITGRGGEPLGCPGTSP